MRATIRCRGGVEWTLWVVVQWSSAYGDGPGFEGQEHHGQSAPKDAVADFVHSKHLNKYPLQSVEPLLVNQPIATHR